MHVDCQAIESTLLQHNINHFKQAHQSIAFKDKIHKKLKYDEVRDKVLKGEINESDYNDKRLLKFLKLLKTQRRIIISARDEGITIQK